MTGARWTHRSIGILCVYVLLCAGESWAEGQLGEALHAPILARERGARSVVFELADRAARGERSAGQGAILTVRLEGEPVGRQELVAIVEGTLLSRVLISMVPGEGARSWQAEVSLARSRPVADRSAGERPKGESVPAVLQGFHRVDVSFARLRGMGLAPFLRRSLYVNLEPHRERVIETKQEPPAEPAPDPVPIPVAPPVVAASALLPGIEREPVPPVQDALIAEADLPLPHMAVAPPPAQDYWQNVEQLVAAKFKQRVRTQLSPLQSPLVQFRLYWDGTVRMVALERSSGSPQLDQAGLGSVVDAHPFPPFPDRIAGSYVDVHVDFAAAKAVALRRTGRKG